MRKSILFISIVLLTGLLSAIVADRVLMHGFRNSNEDVIGKLNELINGETNYQVLFLGSSRCLAHLDPELFEKQTGMNAYNGGLNGGTLVDFNMILEAYLHKRKAPDMVILHIDDFTLESQQISELPRYFPFISNPGIYNGLVNYEESVYYVKHVPFLRVMYYDDLLKWISIKSLTGLEARDEWLMHSGFVRKKVNPEGDWNSFLEEGVDDFLKETNRPFVRNEGVETGLGLFRSFLEICHKHQIRLVLTSSPVVGGISSDRYEKTAGLIADEAKRYQPLIFWKHKEDWDRQIYFYDYLHMNYTGAERFTNELSVFVNSRKNGFSSDNQ
jgi:hypothetical protein